MATKTYTNGIYRVFVSAWHVTAVDEQTSLPMAINNIVPKPVILMHDPAYFREGFYYKDSVLTRLFREGVEAFNQATGLNFREV